VKDKLYRKSKANSTVKSITKYSVTILRKKDSMSCKIQTMRTAVHVGNRLEVLIVKLNTCKFLMCRIIFCPF
jgi:hypothetical protein